MESSPLSNLTGRDRYLVSFALTVAIALLDRAPEEKWQASALADLKRLLATIVDDANSLESVMKEANGLVTRVLSRTVERQLHTPATLDK